MLATITIRGCDIAPSAKQILPPHLSAGLNLVSACCPYLARCVRAAIPWRDGICKATGTGYSWTPRISGVTYRALAGVTRLAAQSSVDQRSNGRNPAKKVWSSIHLAVIGAATTRAVSSLQWLCTSGTRTRSTAALRSALTVWPCTRLPNDVHVKTERRDVCTSMLDERSDHHACSSLLRIT